MNQSHKLIFNSNVQALLKPQCQAMCKMKQPHDMIGPADPISNLRHIKYAIPENETKTEKQLRESREELQSWNEIFWTKHNLSFIKKKKAFIEDEQRKKGINSDEMLSADEISVFYKDFLDKNHKTHLKYLFEWYKKNVSVTFLHLKVNVERIFKKR